MEALHKRRHHGPMMLQQGLDLSYKVVLDQENLLLGLDGVLRVHVIGAHRGRSGGERGGCQSHEGHLRKDIEGRLRPPHTCNVSVNVFLRCLPSMDMGVLLCEEDMGVNL